MARTSDPPVVLIKWYDFTQWLLTRIDQFPKNQRFIFGQRLADHALDVMELLVEAAYRSRKAELLSAANRNNDNPDNENNNIGFRVASPGNEAGSATCLGQTR